MKETIYNWRFHALLWLFLTPIIASWTTTVAEMDERAQEMSAKSTQLSADIEDLRQRAERLSLVNR